jgi:hypothetical protein
VIRSGLRGVGDAARRSRRQPDLAIDSRQQHHPAIAGHAAATKSALDLPPVEPTEVDHTPFEFTLSGTVWSRHRSLAYQESTP